MTLGVESGSRVFALSLVLAACVLWLTVPAIHWALLGLAAGAGFVAGGSLVAGRDRRLFVAVPLFFIGAGVLLVYRIWTGRYASPYLGMFEIASAHLGGALGLFIAAVQRHPFRRVATWASILSITLFTLAATVAVVWRWPEFGYPAILYAQDQQILVRCLPDPHSNRETRYFMWTITSEYDSSVPAKVHIERDIGSGWVDATLIPLSEDATRDMAVLAEQDLRERLAEEIAHGFVPPFAGHLPLPRLDLSDVAAFSVEETYHEPETP